MSEKLGKRSDLDVILCGGTYQAGDLFLPTTYEHSDDFGMLGGEMRNIAAVARASAGLVGHVLFSGGKSRKGAALRGGERVPAPPAAAVYASHFTDFLQADKPDGSSVAMPTVLLDTVSPNTNSNMLYSVQLAVREGWRDVTIISNGYHIPRVTALYEIIKEKLCADDIHTEFVAAEDVAQEAHPGLYDEIIDRAYASPAGQLRIASEARGLADIQAGRYQFREVTAEDLSTRSI